MERRPGPDGGIGRFFGQLPEEKINNFLPNRPRTYAQLAYHIFNIADAWLEHEVDGVALELLLFVPVDDPGVLLDFTFPQVTPAGTAAQVAGDTSTERFCILASCSSWRPPTAC